MRAAVVEALAFAEKVVMPQGAIFIRELLRRKRQVRPDVRIGVNKEEVKENLRAAIRAEAVAMEDLEDFVAEVEGWGNQHIYLYDAGQVADLGVWRQAETRLRQKITQLGYGDAWENTGDPTFPKELAVGLVSYRDGCFEVLWRQEDEHWWREEEKDKPPEVIDGDLYEFRAFRQELKRSVMRFVLFPAMRKAALFVQIPLGKRHTAARDTAEKMLAGLFSFDALTAADISTAIKVLDTRELNVKPGEHGGVRAQNTKFEASGATVEFDADPAIVAWKQVPAVRRVRRALKTSDFSGYGGKFVVSLRLGPGLNRDVVMLLSSRAGRVYLQAQMTSQEVWTILDQVLDASVANTPASPAKP